MTQQITQAFQRRLPSGGTIHIEDIQDQVELALMRSGEYKVARAYVLYREERRKARDAVLKKDETKEGPSTPLITMPNGDVKPLELRRIQTVVEEACRDLDDVSPEPILKDALRNLYHKANLEDVHKALIMSARTLVEKEPNYTYVSARLLLNSLRTEALSKLGMQQETTFDEMTKLYPDYFRSYLSQGVKQGIIDASLQDYDLDELGKALLPERDMQFTYLGPLFHS